MKILFEELKEFIANTKVEAWLNHADKYLRNIRLSDSDTSLYADIGFVLEENIATIDIDIRAPVEENIAADAVNQSDSANSLKHQIILNTQANSLEVKLDYEFVNWSK